MDETQTATAKRYGASFRRDLDRWIIYERTNDGTVPIAETYGWDKDRADTILAALRQQAEPNPADVQVTQADNDLLVKITEWLIREDAIDEDNQKQLNRLGDFLEPLLARHRIAALQQSRSAVIEQCATVVDNWGVGHPHIAKAIRALAD